MSQRKNIDFCIRCYVDNTATGSFSRSPRWVRPALGTPFIWAVGAGISFAIMLALGLHFAASIVSFVVLVMFLGLLWSAAAGRKAERKAGEGDDPALRDCPLGGKKDCPHRRV